MGVPTSCEVRGSSDGDTWEAVWALSSAFTLDSAVLLVGSQGVEKAVRQWKSGEDLQGSGVGGGGGLQAGLGLHSRVALAGLWCKRNWRFYLFPAHSLPYEYVQSGAC